MSRPFFSLPGARRRQAAARLALGIALAPAALAGLLLAASGCGGPDLGLPPYERPAELDIDPALAEPPPAPAAALEAEAAWQPLPAGEVSWSEHVAPILHARCAECHRAGGAAPFALVGYEDARKRAGQIAWVADTGYMPPWKPTRGYGRFVGENRLTPREKGLLAQWAEEGAPEGDPALAPPTPEFSNARWALGEPDVVVPFKEVFTLRASGPDEFRNFVVPDAVDAAVYVRGLEFDPDNPRVVHHAEFRLDGTEGSLLRDHEDPEVGFAGMDSESAQYPEGFFLNWVPGKRAAFEPEDLAWYLGAGDDLVVQLHMLPSGKEEPIRPSVGLHLAEGPPRGVLPVNLRLGSRMIDIPAGESDYVVRDTYTLPVDVEVLSLLPHAHYVGRDLKGFATLPSGERIWLIRIDDWDFNWQDQYELVEPLALPAGTVLGMEYVYDNSAENPRNPHDPPRRVSYGPQSSDEMADLWIRVRTRSEIERNGLKAHHGMHRRLEEIDELERYVRETPEAGSFLDLASRYRSLESRDMALAHVERALLLEPDNADAHEFRGVLLGELERREEGIVALRRAVKLAPGDEGKRYNLALSLLQAGQTEAGRDELVRVVELAPARADALTQLGRLELAEGRAAAARPHLEAALAAGARSLPLLEALARSLALDAESGPDEHARARELALEAAERTRRLDPLVLQTLARAQATNGDFPAAAASAREAARLVPPGGASAALARALAEELAAYEAGRLP